MPETKAFYTAGPVGLTMFKTSSAMLVGTVAMSLYNIVDTYFVGRLGTGPLAAMGFTLPVVMLCGCVFSGVFAGIMTLTAQSLGARDQRRAHDIVVSGLYLTLLMSAILAVAGKLGSHLVFQQLGAEGATLEQTCGYMDIWFLGVFTGMLGMLGGDLLISVGDTRNASAAIVLGTVLNMFLDWLLIFGHWGCPAMGIRGAALATIISQAVGAVPPWLLLHYKYRLFDLRPAPGLLRHWLVQIRFGVPVMLGSVILPVGQTVLTRIAANFGDVAVAATGAVNRLESLAFMVPMSVGFALTPMVGQNYGAGLFERLKKIYRIANTFAFAYLLAIALVILLVARPLVAQFSADPAVQDLMREGLYIIAWGFGLLEIQRYSGFFLTGCGRPSQGAALNIFRICLLSLLSLLALKFQSVHWLFWSRLASDLLSGSIGLVLSGLMVWRLAARAQNPAPEDGR